MTIASTTSKVSYNGSGSTGPFPITFKFAKNADIVATKVSTAGAESTLALTTHYTLTGAGDPSGGTLTLVTALATGEKLVIKRSPAKVQETDYVENAAFPAEAHEGALDLLTMICQDLDEKIGRAVLVGIGSETSPSELLDELAADVASASASAATATTQAGLADTARIAAEEAAASIPTFAAFGLTLAGTATASNARTALELGDAALKSTGTAAGTVCAGDDARLNGASYKNKLINGAFRTNQRGYTSGTALAQGVPSTGVGYGHDGWRAGADGGTYTFTQSNGPTVVTITAGSLISVAEGLDIDQANMVLSWEGSAQARVGVNGAAPSGSYAASPILVTATVGANVAVEFGTGTVDRVQLENGAARSAFEWPDAAAQLARCRRRLPSVMASASDFGLLTVFGGSTILANGVVHFGTRARAAVTGLIASSAGFLNLYSRVAFVATSTSLAVWVGGNDGAIIDITVARGGLTVAKQYFVLSAGAGFLLFTGAEL